MLRILSRALPLLAILGGAAGAAAQTWQPLGPEGGVINLVHGISGGSGRAIAIGNNGAFASSDSGRTWHPLAERNLTGPIATHHPYPARNFAFDLNGRLLRSEDWGETWQPTGYATPNDVIESIASISTGVMYSSHLYGTFYSLDQGETFAPSTGLPAGGYLEQIYTDKNTSLPTAVGSDGKLYRTADRGATWTVLSTLPTLGYPLGVVAITDRHLVVSLGGHVVVSTDGGATWIERADLPNARLVRVDPNGTRVLATNGQDCNISSDGFVTANFIDGCDNDMPVPPRWQQSFLSLTSVYDGGSGSYRVLANDGMAGVVALNDDESSWSRSNSGLYATSMRGLALAPNDSGTLWTGRFPDWYYGGALLSTTDNGAHWTRQLENSARYLRTFALDETTAANPATTRLYAAGWAEWRPAGQTDSGIWASDDGGASWNALNDGLPTFDNGQYSGVLLSVTRKLALDPRSCANPPASGTCTQGPLNTLYAITDGSNASQAWRIIKRTQGGPWTAIDAGMTWLIQDAAGYDGMNAVDLEVEPSTSTLYLSVFGSYYNDDDSPRTPTLATGVFRSTNGGASWTHAATGLPLHGDSTTTTKDVFAIALHPRRAGTLWASTIQIGETSSQISRSTDSGDHWTPVGTPLTGCDVRDLQVDSAAPDVIYAAGVATAGTGCLWRSEDAGATWTPLHGTLPAYTVYDVRQDPKDHRRLVVATDHGVWSVLAPSDRIFTDTFD